MSKMTRSTYDQHKDERQKDQESDAEKIRKLNYNKCTKSFFLSRMKNSHTN